MTKWKMILLFCIPLIFFTACRTTTEIDMEDKTEILPEQAALLMSENYLEITSQDHTAIFQLYDTAAAKEL